MNFSKAKSRRFRSNKPQQQKETHTFSQNNLGMSKFRVNEYFGVKGNFCYLGTG